MSETLISIIPRLIWISAVVLLPLVPAYVLFRALPSTGSVSGFLKGMEFKFGGGFAGYLVVLLLIKGTFAPAQVWMVTGQLTLPEASSSLSEVQIILSPEERKVIKDGRIRLPVVINGNLDPDLLPTVIFEGEDYRLVYRSLEEAETDAWSRRFDLGEVKLEKKAELPPYDETASTAPSGSET